MLFNLPVPILSNNTVKVLKKCTKSHLVLTALQLKAITLVQYFWGKSLLCAHKIKFSECNLIL